MGGAKKDLGDDDRLNSPILKIYLGFLMVLATSTARMDFVVSPVALAQPSLFSPNSIAYHPSGLWVVSDTGNDRIVLLNMDLSINATSSGVLNRPRGVAVDHEGRIWVADGGNDRVVLMGPDLSILEVIGSSGADPGQFSLPWGVDFGPNGTMAVADALNRRIQVIDGHNPAFVFGSWGTGPGNFDGPLDLAFDSNGRLYVVDTYLQAEGYVRRVQVFNSDFTFNSTIWDIDNRLRFTRPVGIGISPEDVVAVADYLANRVYFFNSEGEHMGGLTAIEGQPSLKSPNDVAFAPLETGDSLMAIVERDEDRVRVVRFSVSETLILAFLLSLALVLNARRGRGRWTRT